MMEQLRNMIGKDYVPIAEIAFILIHAENFIASANNKTVEEL